MRRLWITLIIIGIMVGLGKPSLALEDCSGKTGDEAANCWSGRVSELQGLINQSKGQQKTLTDTISYLSNKIYLTQAQIYQKEEELKLIEEEIVTLSVRIDRLNTDLNDVSKILLSRIDASYKRMRVKPILMIFQSNNFNEYFTKTKYLNSAQTNDRKILYELQSTKDDFQNQKKLKEEKQAQEEKIRQELAQQKTILNSQNQEKQRLLETTKNDEKRYQSLLSEAQTQKSAFRRFISSLGGATILSNQTKCDDWGCYYNQRDGQWGNQRIGLSDSSMAEYGCLITSMAMIASHYGKSLTPGNIANSSDPFFGNTALMWQGDWTVNGVTMNRIRLGSSLENIDNELAAGRPVIVGIYGGPDHFLVIKGKENGEYIMNDPFPEGARNIKFTDKYNLSAITQVDRVTVQ